MKLRPVVAVSALALVLVAALWAPERRAYLPWATWRAQRQLQACEHGPLSDPSLIAALRGDMRECPELLRSSLAESTAVRDWLRAQLSARHGSELQRLRASQALLAQPTPATEPVVADLHTGGLGPSARQSLLQEFWPTLREGGAQPFDPTGALAAQRFASGDRGARAELAEALERELLWPSLPSPPSDPSAAHLSLVQGTLQGLGWPPSLLAEALSDLDSGRPVQTLDGPTLRALQRHGSDCAVQEPACLRFLLEQLDQWAALPAPPLPPLPGIAPRDLPLLHAAAQEIRSSSDPAGRLLGLVAHPNSTYGAPAWRAGQRGEPALALRYAGSTPGASASAALALAQASGVELLVLTGLVDARPVLVLEAGGRRAVLGDCGPGSASLPPTLSPLEPAAVLELAQMERVAGFAASGELDQALDASRTIQDSGQWKDWMILRSSLLACQGIEAPAQPNPTLSAAWASACGHPALATSLLKLSPLQGKESRNEPPAVGCGPSLRVAAPASLGEDEGR